MINTGSPTGNPGYSFAAGAYNPLSGRYEGGGATWVGQGQAPAGSQDQFRNWVGSQNPGAANGMNFVGQAPNYGAPNQPQAAGYPQQGGNVQAGGPGGFNPGGGGAQFGQPSPTQGGMLGGTFGQAAPGVAPPTGLIGSEMAQQQGLSGALGGIQGGLDNFNQNANRASNLLGGYATNGQGASGIQAAQSGALGAPAQQNAFNNFNDSPGQQFLRDRGEQAVIRNAAAMGGVGGGNVQKALATFGQGLAQQDFDNQFNRLGQVSDRGFQATQLQSGIAQNQGAAGMNAANLGANYNFNTGQQMASGRTRAGEQIADSISNTTSGLSALINQQGQNLSSVVGAGGNNISSLLAGLGQQTGASQEQLAAMLGNISIGEGSQVASLPSLGQFVQADQTLNTMGQVASGVGNAITAYQGAQKPQTQTQQAVQAPGPVGSLYNGNFNTQSGIYP